MRSNYYIKNKEEFYDTLYKYASVTTVAVVAKYATMNDILINLLKNEDIAKYEVRYINNFGNPENTGYDEEYLLEINENEIYLEPYKVKTKTGKKYLIFDSDEIFVHDGCSSDAVVSFGETYIHVFPYSLCDCDHTECKCKDNNKDTWEPSTDIALHPKTDMMTNAVMGYIPVFFDPATLSEYKK